MASAPYTHLIGGAAPGLALASCYYFDDFDFDKVKIGDVLTLVDRWFSMAGYHPKVVIAHPKIKERGLRYTAKKLREVSASGESLERFKAVSWFPKGRTTIEDTWFPPVVFNVSCSRGRPSAFFYAVTGQDFVIDREVLIEAQQIFNSCAAYLFAFPLCFSPDAYNYGMQVQPADRTVGSYASREGRRLVNHRDNTSIGVEIDGERRFFHPCGGYIRDVYPLMLLSEVHMARKVGLLTLHEAIAANSWGSVEPLGDRFLWRIPDDRLSMAQMLLDDFRITLSGARMDEPLKAGGSLQ
jgi:hypothetical protein